MWEISWERIDRQVWRDAKCRPHDTKTQRLGSLPKLRARAQYIYPRSDSIEPWLGDLGLELMLLAALLRLTAGHSSSPGSAAACDRLVVSFGTAQRTDGAPLFGTYELQRSAIYCGQPVWSRTWHTSADDGFGRGASLFYACTMGSAGQGWVVSERLDTGSGDMLHLLAPLREEAQAPLRMPWAGPDGGTPMNWHASRRVARRGSGSRTRSRPARCWRWQRAVRL